MAKLTLNDHLDDMLERLMNENLTTAELELETKRVKAVAHIATKKIENAKMMIQAVKAVNQGDVDVREMTKYLELPEKK